MSWIKRRKPLSRNKYGNATKKGSDGRTYHSIAEKDLAEHYMLLERAGEVKILKRQARFHFVVNGVKIGEYWPDFQIENLKTGEIYYSEFKGFEQPVWAYKKKLYEALGDIRLEVWKQDRAKRLYLDEEIKPLNPSGAK